MFFNETRKPHIHPIEFMQSDDAGNILMSTRAFLAKVEQNGKLSWIPTALLRQRVPDAGWQEFNELVPYDMRIFVNDDRKFAVSESSCAFVAARGITCEQASTYCIFTALLSLYTPPHTVAGSQSYHL